MGRINVISSILVDSNVQHIDWPKQNAIQGTVSTSLQESEVLDWDTSMWFLSLAMPNIQTGQHKNLHFKFSVVGCSQQKHMASHEDSIQIITANLASYLLGLLAMIKCSICSYQCDNWYVSNWRLACHMIFDWGGCRLGLPSAPQMLPWHGTLLWATHPQRVTVVIKSCAPLLESTPCCAMHCMINPLFLLLW